MIFKNEFSRSGFIFYKLTNNSHNRIIYIKIILIFHMHSLFRINYFLKGKTVYKTELLTNKIKQM